MPPTLATIATMAAITAPPSLETLMFYYVAAADRTHAPTLPCAHTRLSTPTTEPQGTDKSHDDHKYVDLYSALFDPIRSSARNITEIGLAQGQSLQVWHDFFPQAQIWGLDIVPAVIAGAKELFASAPRVQTFRANSKSAAEVSRIGLSLGSMDVIIDDGDHFPPGAHRSALYTLH